MGRRFLFLKRFREGKNLNASIRAPRDAAIVQNPRHTAVQRPAQSLHAHARREGGRAGKLFDYFDQRILIENASNIVCYSRNQFASS